MPERMQFQQQNRNFGLYKAQNQAAIFAHPVSQTGWAFFTPIPLIEKRRLVQSQSLRRIKTSELSHCQWTERERDVHTSLSLCIDNSLIQFQRTCIQLIICPVQLNQVVVGAALDDAAVVENHNRVRVLHCGQAVGDDKGGASRMRASMPRCTMASV